MLISPAYAQDAASDPMVMVAQFAPLLLIFGVFYFLLIRPQQQKQKAMRTALGTLKRGDRVLTGGGIIGTVARVPPDRDGKPVLEIEVEIAPNLKVTVLRETITSIFKSSDDVKVANDSKPSAS
ncbi:MAG: preprotein translocase subunit YajC [Acetobacteraceae bacterium]|nr:preprotein translocase subunit YajC [Acetobacteraceae bacterium]MSP31046.1 preprotein translocase subunit YajC [Acetobacteraceae bacterium]